MFAYDKIINILFEIKHRITVLIFKLLSSGQFFPLTSLAWDEFIAVDYVWDKKHWSVSIFTDIRIRTMNAVAV